MLGYFVARRRDLPFRRLFLLFGAFILLCGATHLMEAIIFWRPAYRLAGVLKLLTAVVSWLTVFALVRVAPAVLAMRAPDELEREVAARADAERRLTEANAELERRVAERTADLSRAAAAEAEQTERLRTTLASIGDAVISTDRGGGVTYLNAVAEALTGWTNGDARGQPLEAVFRIVNESTRSPVANPANRALTEGVIVGLANHTVLIARDGAERPIDDSAAPIRDRDGAVVGGVLVFRDVTERRAAEARVQAERDRVQLLADAVPTLISYIDADARYQLNNRAYETWFGRPRGDLVGRPMRDVLGEAAWAAIRPHVDAALAGRAVSYEAEVPYRDGGVRWVMASYTPDIGGDGAVRGVIAHLTDITDVKRAEQQFATTLESVTDGFMRYDREWRIVYANAEAERINQLPPGRRCSAGSSGRSSRPSSGRSSKPSSSGRPRTGRRSSSRTTTSRSAGGTPSKGYPTSDGGLTTFIRGVTETKRAAEQLRESEERFRSIFSQTVAGVAQTDLIGRFVLVNQRYGEILGRPAGELTGLWMQDVTHRDDVPRDLPLFQATAAGGPPFVVEKRYVRPDGSDVWASNSVSLVRDGRGRPKYVVAVALDVTERKEMERQLRASEERSRLLSDVSARLVLRGRTEQRESADELLASVFADVAGRLGAEYYFNFAVCDEPRELRLISCQGVDAAAQAALGRIRFGEYLCGLVAETRRPLVVEDLQKYPLSNGATMCAMGANSYAGYPLLSDGRLIGTISFATARRRPLTADELGLVQAVADLLAAAVERDRLSGIVRDSEARFRELADAMPQIVCATGAGGRIEYVNRQWREYTGEPDDRVTDLSPGVHPDDLADMVRRRDQAAAAGTLLQAEFRLRRASDGEYRWFLTRSVPIRDEGGRVVRWYGTSTDIHDQKRAELEIARLAAESERQRRLYETVLTNTPDFVYVFSLDHRVVYANDALLRMWGPGRGSEFVVRLPLVPPPGETLPAADGTPPTALIGRRILVVDDNVDSAVSLGELLTFQGNDVRTAHDGLAAVEAARAFRPELVLLDIGLPELSGCDVACWIRREPWGRDVILVALTGWGQDEDRRRSREAGFDLHIVKPLELAALEKLLADLKRPPR